MLSWVVKAQRTGLWKSIYFVFFASDGPSGTVHPAYPISITPCLIIFVHAYFGSTERKTLSLRRPQHLVVRCPPGLGDDYNHSKFNTPTSEPALSRANLASSQAFWFDWNLACRVDETTRQGTRQLVPEGKSISAVARTFDVHPATIYRVIEG